MHGFHARLRDQDPVEGILMVRRKALDSHGVFVADEVLAKHDEKYMPPEVARSLKQGQAAAGNSQEAPH